MLSNDRRYQEEGENQNNVEPEYHERVKRLQHYVPFLKKMIEHLEGAKDKNRETQIIKIRSLLNILTDARKKLKLPTIQRCEEILKKLYSKFEGVGNTLEWSIELPSDLCKNNPDKEDTLNSNGSISSPTVVDSPLSSESSTRDDPSAVLWRRRRTAMDYFEETPRSPSPPSSAEVGHITQPVVIPMERNDETIPQPVMFPLPSKENYFDASAFLPVMQKEEQVPKPPVMPLVHKEDFEAKWYQGESRSQDTGRQNNHFGMINSSFPSDPGISHQNTSGLQPISFTHDVPSFCSSQSIASSSVSDIPSLEELRIQRHRSEFEYHGSDRASSHIPDGGDRYFKEHYECPSKEWIDTSFEGRRTSSTFQSLNESSQNSVMGSAHVYEYAHGQNSSVDSFESSRELPGETEDDKSKISPKTAARASIREKLAMEINKVHRVGVSLGGSLRSLSKDLGSPPHKKLEVKDVSPGNESAHRRNSVSGREGEDCKSKNVERRLSDSVSQSGNAMQAADSNASAASGKDIGCVETNEKDAPLTSRNLSGSETPTNRNHKNSNLEKQNSSDEHSDPISQGVVAGSGDLLEGFSFKKKLLENKLSPDQKIIGPPTNSSSAIVKSGDDEGQTPNVTQCDGDDDSDDEPKIPLLGSKNSVPLCNMSPSISTYTLPKTSVAFSEQKYKPSLNIPLQHSTNTILKPFINPSNPTSISPAQVSHREESNQVRNWNSPSPVGSPGIYPNFFPQNASSQNMTSTNIAPKNMAPKNIASQNMAPKNIASQNMAPQNMAHQNMAPQNITPQNMTPQNINSPNAMISNTMVHHNVNSPVNMMQPNTPSHAPHMDASHRAQHNAPQYMNVGSHPSHNMNITPANQGPRPMGKGLLPNPVPPYRQGHGWGQGQNVPRMGLLPHPVRMQTWRNDSYPQPLMNKHINEPRQPLVAQDVRSHHPRGGWNSRRGGYPKINDPRNRNPDYSRPYSDSAEIKKKPEIPKKPGDKYCWKHPSDPRRASPAATESKRPMPPVPKVLPTTTVSSPLNSLYDADQTPKTGKGYGLQKFRIPKLNREPKSLNQHQNPVVPVPPPKEVVSQQKPVNIEKKVEEEKEESKVDIKKEEEEEEEVKKEEVKKEEVKNEDAMKEDTSKDDSQKESDKEEQERKSREEFTKELFQTLLKISLESQDGAKILENTKFLDELREKLKLSRPKRSRPIIESDSESSEEEEESSPITSKSKKRCRVIAESSESEEVDEDKNADEDKETSPVKPASGDTPSPVERKPRSCKKSPQAVNLEALGGRPRTRSQRKLFTVDDESEDEDKVKEDTVVAVVKDEIGDNQGDKSGMETPNDETPKTITPAPNRRTKRRSSLELLQEDIREMFICEGVMSATGVRMCRLLKEAAGDTNEDLNADHSSSKESEDIDSSSLSQDPAEDVSEDSTVKSPVRRLRRKVRTPKVTSLQPRVLLKKTEIIKDVGDSSVTTHASRRGGCARRSLKRRPNIGQRSSNNQEDLNKSALNEFDVELENLNENKDNKEGISDANEEMDCYSNSQSNAEAENDKQENGNIYKETLDKDGQNKLPEDVNGDDHPAESDTFHNDTEKENDLDNSEGESSHEAEEEEDQGESEKLMKQDGKARRSGSSRKKHHLKKRSKANRKWALGVLKRAVNHKRRGLNSSSVSPPKTIDEEHSITEMSVEELGDGALVDVNYICNGNDAVKCRLCAYVGKQIVNHYVTKHPESDVLVSRLTSEQTRIAWDWTKANQGAIKNVKLALRSPGPFVCLMCEAWHSDYAEFYDHVSTHTGEYRFSCKMCPYRSFRDSNVRSHAYYVHHKKYSESSDCYLFTPVEELMPADEVEESEMENSSVVIPGLVSHLCSKCNFVQILEKNVEKHIALRHKDGDGEAKVLKIDMSLIAPEPPSMLLPQGKDDLSSASNKMTSEESNDAGGDENSSDFSFDLSNVKKEEEIDEKSVKTFDSPTLVKIKEEECPVKSKEDDYEVDEKVFLIDDDQCDPVLNEKCTSVWSDVLDHPELDDEICVVKCLLNIKIDDDDEEPSELDASGAKNVDVKGEVVENDLSKKLPSEKKLPVELEKEMSGINDFGVISKDGCKDLDEGKNDDAQSHTSEVEIIEINDDSSDSKSEYSSNSGSSSDSDSTYDSDSSSEDDSSIEELPLECTPPDSVEGKEKTSDLETPPDVKMPINLLGIANKFTNSKSILKELLLKAESLFGERRSDDKPTGELGNDGNIITPESSALPQDSDVGSDAVQPNKLRIRVRCLSGDLLSSTKEPQMDEDLTNQEPEPIVDVTSTSPIFEPDSENTFCQISSVCSLHPNEEVPEEFIKAVSENETPDLTSLAAYTPNPFSSSSMYYGTSDSPNNSQNGFPKFRPILPKPTHFVPPAYVPPADMTVHHSKCPSLNTYQSTQEGSAGVCSEESGQIIPCVEELPSGLTAPPKKQTLFEQDCSTGKTAVQPATQLKICSIMRACLYAKASKTPDVFNKVMSNQMKLCHLFKCMGRQCHFTTDESVVFLSHFLGHESLESDSVCGGKVSGEPGENKLRKFDWQHCCYCTEMFTSASVYVKHIQMEHGECIYQCPYCFYRAAAVSYVILHQNSSHITEKVSVLECKNTLKKNSEEQCKVQPHLEAYVCYQGNCKRSFYSPNRYLTHLQVEHSAVSIYCCHKCSYQCFKADRLIQHYKFHSFYLYQCVYCDQGSDTSEEILQHLASFHPNKRASVCKRNSEESSQGAARTTGRNPYILYEDIELTEMENVDLIPYGEKLPMKPAVSPAKNENVPAEKKTLYDSEENDECIIDVTDGTTDDEGNLVIAEDLDEDDEMPTKKNSGVVKAITDETTESDVNKISIADAKKQSIADASSFAVEGNQPEKSVWDKNVEMARVEDVRLNEHESRNVKEGSGQQEGENVKGVSESKGESRMEEQVTPSKCGSSELPVSKTAESKDSPALSVFQQASPRKSSEKRQVLKDRKNLKPSIEVDILDVCGDKEKSAASTEEARCLRRRDAAARMVAPRSLAESKQKSAAEESHGSSGGAKENVSLKEAANRKVDRAKLYQCCFSNCSFLANDCNHLKDHIKTCPFSQHNNIYNCPHCSRLYKNLPSMLKHLRVHGKKSYVCMVCPFQGAVINQALQHVKSRHRAPYPTVNPLADWEEPEEVALATKDHKLIVVAPKEVSMSFLLRKRFVPEDADYLPYPWVYSRDAKCTRCSYSTKIRSNMRRHLHLHLKFNQSWSGGHFSATQVTWSVKDHVNPMPCLEGKELMFDKMTNWAISSHLDAKVKEEEEEAIKGRRDSLISEYEEDNFLPRYVPENERYICGVDGCHYQTVDDTMLRHHLRALHREETTFRCAHCPDEQNLLNQVPVDRLASHLKMHDDQLYQCIHCNYFHFQRRFVERHTIDKHGDKTHMVNIIRESDKSSRAVSGSGSCGMAGTGTDGSIRSSNPSGNNEMVKYDSDNIWNCGLCNYSCLMRESISDHARITHSVFSQFVCGMCTFRSAHISSFTLHFSLKHLGYPVQLIANYFRNNIAMIAPPTSTIVLPNGKVIFPPNPLTGKSVDPRTEPIIEVWPFVEKGFGRSSSSSVRLKELNTTYPWQRCMPRVRYIRGIPIADEGEETMYDLAESLKVKDDLKKDDTTEEGTESQVTESGDSSSTNIEMANASTVSSSEGVDGPSSTELEHAAKPEMQKVGKRRLSDASKSDSASLDGKRKSDVGKPITPVKASPVKKSVGRNVGSSPSPKVQKFDTPASESNSICSQSDVEELDVEILCSVVNQVKSDSVGSERDKVEALKKLYGEYGESEGNLFVCPICHKYKTKYKQDMKEHLYRELNYKRFVCTHCGLLAHAKKTLQKHYVRVHKKDGKLEATAELPPDKDIELWVQHALDDQFRAMKTRPSLGGTLLEETPKTQSNTPLPEGAVAKNSFSCRSCTSRFSTIRGGKIHFKVHHLKLGSWICGHCDVSGNSEVVIMKHNKSSHPRLEELVIFNTLSGILDFKSLDDCEVFRSEIPVKSIEKLYDSNSQQEVFQRFMCEYRTNESDALKKHEGIHPELQNYSCGHCSYTSDQEWQVMEHHSKEHPFTPLKVIKRSGMEKGQAVGKGNAGSITPRHENVEVKVDDEQDDVKILEETTSEPDTIVTLENIGEFGKADQSYFFKCYYCRMKSHSCDDVVNHWENVHLPTDIRNTHPFKCKRMPAKNPENLSSLPPSVYQCKHCCEMGTIFQLKGHFKTAHPENDFKVLSLQNFKYCCMACDYVCGFFHMLEGHFKVSHPCKDFEFKMRLDDGDNDEESLGEGKGGGGGLSFKGSSKRESLVEEKFLKDAVFYCFLCNISYLSFSSLRKHFSASHPIFPFKYSIEVKVPKSEGSGMVQVADTVKVYNCHVCSKTINSLIDLIDHIRDHVLPYMCGSCSFRTDLPSKVTAHHFVEHPLIQRAIITIDPGAVSEMIILYKKIKVLPIETKEGSIKRRAQSPLPYEPKKQCPVARKSTTQVSRPAPVQKPTARKSTNPSAEFIKNLKSWKNSPQIEEIVLDDDEDMEVDISDEDVGSSPSESTEVQEFSFYNGGKGVVDRSVNLSRITVCMTFGGCAAKRVQVSKMAQLVDLEPCLIIEDMNAKF